MTAPQLPPANRPTISGSRHMISAGHYLAATAGFQILEAGGNAIDAGCAAGIALGVLQSDIVNVAGVAPIMIYSAAEDRVITIAGLGGWPKALDPELFMREHGGKMPSGVLRTVVPAAPDAWITALARWGSMSFGQVAEAAIRFAGEGFAMYALMADSVAKNAEGYRSTPETAAIYLPGGTPPVVGALFRQQELAASLQYMADEERAAGRTSREAGLEAARAAFYRGDIAQKILAHHRAEGGLLQADDLAGYRSPVVPPVVRRHGDLDVYTCDAWCQGPVLLQALGILAGTDVRGLGHNSPTYIHRVTEAIKLAFADREAFYGDPDFIDVPLDRLLDPAYCRERAGMIDDGRAWPEMPPAGKPLATPLPAGAAGDPRPEPDTSYVCAVDKHGNVFSATPSDGSWNVPVTPGTGLVVSSRGSQSRPDPRHPAGVAPGKRPRLTPNPALAVERGRRFLPFGTPGGDVQSQSMLQVLLNVFAFGMDPQQAIEAPRFASYSYPSSFAPFEYYPGRLNLEARIARDVGDDLARRGHQVNWWPEWTWLAGGVCAILADQDTGLMQGGADPRRLSYAVGW
jgi:gamma-glutamyltranspeptidase/glutathione hydrolase